MLIPCWKKSCDRLVDLVGLFRPAGELGSLAALLRVGRRQTSVMASGLSGPAQKAHQVHQLETNLIQKRTCVDGPATCSGPPASFEVRQARSGLAGQLRNRQ